MMSSCKNPFDETIQLSLKGSASLETLIVGIYTFSLRYLESTGASTLDLVAGPRVFTFNLPRETDVERTDVERWRRSQPIVVKTTKEDPLYLTDDGEKILDDVIAEHKRFNARKPWKYSEEMVRSYAEDKKAKESPVRRRTLLSDPDDKASELDERFNVGGVEQQRDVFDSSGDDVAAGGSRTLLGRRRSSPSAARHCVYSFSYGPWSVECCRFNGEQRTRDVTVHISQYPESGSCPQDHVQTAGCPVCKSPPPPPPRSPWSPISPPPSPSPPPSTPSLPSPPSPPPSPPFLEELTKQVFNSKEPGPLIDAIEIDAGASYFTQTSLQASWRAAFTSITQFGEDDPNRERFCASKLLESSALKATFLDECSGEMVKMSAANDANNAILQLQTTISTAISARWYVRGSGFGFVGGIEVTHLGRIVASVSSSLPAEAGSTIELHVDVHPGTYTFSLYGAYDGKAGMAAKAGEKGATPVLEFKEPKYCRIFAWEPLVPGKMHGCNSSFPFNGPLDEAEAAATAGEEENDDDDDDVDAEREVSDVASADVPNDVAEGETEEEEDWTINYDGVYLKVVAQVDEKLFIARGSFNLFGLMCAIDLSVVLEGREAGIHLWFKVEWRNVFTGDLLFLIEGNFDLTPIDFSDKKSILKVKAMAGLTIKPFVINTVLKIIEVPIKLILKIVLMPILLVISVLLKVLNKLIDALEKKIKAYRKVVTAVKARIDAAIGKFLNKLNAAERAVADMDSRVRAEERKRSVEKSRCKVSCSWYKLICKIKKAVACVKAAWYTVKIAAIRVFQMAARLVLKIIRALVKALVKVIMFILEIPAIAMAFAKGILIVSAVAVSLIIKPLGFFPVFRPCIGCTALDTKCFWDAWKDVSLLRIYEISVGMEFSMKKVGFAALLDFEVFSKRMTLSITISFSLTGFFRAIKDLVVGFFKSVFAGAKKLGTYLICTDDTLGAPYNEMEANATFTNPKAAALGGTPPARALAASDVHVADFLESHHESLDPRAPRRRSERPEFGAWDEAYFSGVTSAGAEEFTPRRAQITRHATHELESHVDASAVIAGVLARTPVYAVALSIGGDDRSARTLHGSSSSSSLAPLMRLSGVKARFAAGEPVAAIVAAAEASPGDVRDGFERLMRAVGVASAAEALNAAPSVTRACLPSLEAPLRAVREALLKLHGETAAAARSSSSRRSLNVGRGGDKVGESFVGPGHATAGDALADALGVPRVRLERTVAASASETTAAAAAARAAAVDVCAVAGASAALHCGALRLADDAKISPLPSSTAARTRAAAFAGCIHALNTLAKPICSSEESASTAVAASALTPRACVAAALEEGLSCPKACGGALMKTASACRGLVPRAGFDHLFSEEHVVADDTAAAACSIAVADAQRRCVVDSGRPDDAAAAESFSRCASILDAVPQSQTSQTVIEGSLGAGAPGRGAPGAAAPPRVVSHEWSEANHWGVLPATACDATATAVVDVRGNNLLGRPPACVWERATSARVLLSRNHFTGSLGALSADVEAAHVGFNRVSGDVGDVFGIAIAGGNLRVLHANDNAFVTGAKGLEALASKTSRLRDLDLSGNALGPLGSHELPRHIAAAARLERYDVGGNAWNFDEVTAAVAGGADPTEVHVALEVKGPDAIVALCGACPGWSETVHSGGDALDALVDVCVETGGCASSSSSSSSFAEGDDDDEALRDLDESTRLAAIAYLKQYKNRPDPGLGGWDAAIRDALLKHSGTKEGWIARLVTISPTHDGAARLAYTLSPSPSSSSPPRDDDHDDDHASASAYRVSVSHAVNVLLSAARSSSLDLDLLGHRDGRVVVVGGGAHTEVRPACPNGRFGATCDYFCGGEWHRAIPAKFQDPDGGSADDIVARADEDEDEDMDAVNASARRAAVFASLRRELHTEEEEKEKSDLDVALLGGGGYRRHLYSHRDDYDCDDLGSLRGDCSLPSTRSPVLHEHSDDVDDASELYVTDGDNNNNNGEGGERRRRPAVTLAIHDMNDCGAACRAEVKIAVHECRVWLGDRDDETLTSACVDAMSSMRASCGRHVAKDEDAATVDETKKTTRKDGCAAPSNVLSYFAAHGVYDAKLRKRFRRLDLHKHEVIAARIAAAFENEELARAQDARHNRRRQQRQSSVTAAGSHPSDSGRLEGGGRAATRLAELGTAEAYEHDGLPFKDARTAAGSGVVAPIASMFPTCSVHHGCSLRCRHHLRDVLDACMRFVDMDASARRGAIGSEMAVRCEEVIRASDDACDVKSGDRSACADPLTSGFRALINSNNA